MEEKNRINTVIKTAIENLSEIIDSNAVIGNPIKTDNGDVIIPIAKISLGILSGGGEYGKVGLFKSEKDLPYSAGNGAVVSLKPCAFLVKDSLGYKIVNIEKDGVEKLIEKTADVFVELNHKIVNEFKNFNTLEASGIVAPLI